MSNHKTRLVVSLLVCAAAMGIALPTAATTFAPATSRYNAELNANATTTSYADPTPVLEEIATSRADLYTWLDKLALYESGNRAHIRVLDVNNRYSYGCLQFQMATWLSYGSDLGATEENIYDCSLQKRVAHQMISDRYSNWRHWSFTVQSRMRELPPVE